MDKTTRKLSLRVPSLDDLEQVRLWRMDCRETLRTPYDLTAEMQEDYYHREICNRDSKTRYWSLVLDYSRFPADRTNVKESRHSWETYSLIGYGGIENIEWENSKGEMSLLIAPEYQGKGYGAEAVELFLEQAFKYLNLQSVYGECYECGPWEFWQKEVNKREAFATWLPYRKFYDGYYYASYYFTFDKMGAYRIPSHKVDIDGRAMTPEEVQGQQAT